MRQQNIVCLWADQQPTRATPCRLAAEPVRLDEVNRARGEGPARAVQV